MSGFDENDFIKVWLDGRAGGLPMSIDSPTVKEIIQKEIERTRAFAERRIQDLQALLDDKYYFSN